ncbi:MAG: DUF2282 domain-containing protein [Burkholderiaceae bacterium]|nr:DUF2282 domain-containing protein [Burkholderiaceae bacterium]
MKQHAMIAAALGSLLALGALSTPVQAADAAGKEKCFGVAKAGQNDCASPGSAHACAGQSKMDKDSTSWKFVPAGTCMQMGGSLQAPAK